MLNDIRLTPEEVRGCRTHGGVGLIDIEQLHHTATDKAIKKIHRELRNIDRATEGEAQYYNAMRHFEESLKNMVKE